MSFVFIYVMVTVVVHDE